MGWTLVYLCITVFLCFTIALWWNAWHVKCIRKLNEWLVVHTCQMLVHVFVHLAYSIIWIKAKDPTYQLTRIRVFFHVWVYLFEAAWLIYGNTFVYSSEMRECGEDNDVEIDYII